MTDSSRNTYGHFVIQGAKVLPGQPGGKHA